MHAGTWAAGFPRHAASLWCRRCRAAVVVRPFSCGWARAACRYSRRVISTQHDGPGTEATDADATPREGDVLGPVRIDAVAHGGHFVGRHEGRVLFVRGTMIGELVMVRLTDTSKARFWLGEAAEVLEASPDRVVPPCPIAGVCGGCDFQHLTASAQRRLKGLVVVEQLQRLAHVDAEELTGVTFENLVEPADLDDPDALLGWRTRMRYRTMDAGLAMLQHHSNDLVALPDEVCLIASPEATGPIVARHAADADGGGLLAVVSDDAVTVLPTDAPDAPLVHQDVDGVDYEVAADGFWQVHPLSAQVLARAVVSALDVRPGERALDLYCGVGLFAGQLAAEGAEVFGVEANPGAVDLARRNVPTGRFRCAGVERMTRDLPDVDVVVLDPPRKGAGARVVRAVAGLGARAIAYVACDPASLARDVATFADEGWELVGLRAYDLFPMTHHVECVALLEPAPRHRGRR